jgi:hypothetical protein
MWSELPAWSGLADGDGADPGTEPRKTLAQATWQIIIGDVLVFLENVLGVAGKCMVSREGGISHREMSNSIT